MERRLPDAPWPEPIPDAQEPVPCPLGEGAPVDEAELARRLKAGDATAFEIIVRTYSARLLAVTRRILGNDEDAQDAVQETLLSAFRNASRFEGGSRVSTWLHRIAVNAALMKLRSRRRKPEQPIEPLLPAFREDGHHVEQFSSWDPPIDVALQSRHARALVRRLIGELPESYRVVLMLRDIEELSTEETAAALGITPNAAKIRLHRARQALRTLLAPHFRRQEL
jgi:RNA polymerase sigma-70 factor (ECF subfamily)